MRRSFGEKMRYKLDFSYKGARNYLQGGDFFNAIQAVVDSLDGFRGSYVSKLSLAHFSYHLCELCFDEMGEKHSVGSGELTLQDNSRKFFWLKEGFEKPAHRTPYNEGSIVRNARYEGQSVVLQASVPYSTIEVVIALTKDLHYRLSPIEEGKWVFGRIDLNQRLPIINRSVSIARVKHLPLRFSVSEIKIDGIMIGEIQFIVGRP